MAGKLAAIASYCISLCEVELIIEWPADP
jgi:hypothetical protein